MLASHLCLSLFVALLIVNVGAVRIPESGPLIVGYTVRTLSLSTELEIERLFVVYSDRRAAPPHASRHGVETH